MSALRITHETIYRYNRPVQFGPHRLVLRPREGHDLQIERMSLIIEPAHTLAWHRDVFGNSIVTVVFHSAASELRILNEIDVRRFELPRISQRCELPVPFPVVYEDMETTVARAYLQSTYPGEAKEINHWVDSFLEQTGRSNALAIASALNDAVRKEIKYVRRDEKGVQTPAQTLANRAGSCRDKATLLMEGCRAVGIAARFCSGYLDCAASEAGTASTHAWAEAYLPSQGWIGFDPTLGAQTSAKHIATGLSNHPRGVMPVTGSFYGVSADYLGMNVSVKFTKQTTEPLLASA